MFASSGELVALQVEGESMIDAGILPGDYVIIRRQDCVEEGEIAAVLVDGETTLKRWHRQQRSGRSARIASGPAAVFSGGPSGKLSRARQESKETVETVETVRLVAANERFAPIEITEDDRKEVIVFGKYVGLVRGELRIV
jgi:SOS-response transcriptional repressor LexA